MTEEKKDFGLRVLEIKELSYFNKLSDDLINNFKEEEIDIKLGFGISGDREQKTISLSIIVHFKYPIAENSEFLDFFKIETETTFKIFNFTEDDVRFDNDDNQIFINDNIMSVFLDTSIGATRGMIATKITSLPIHFVLPLFDVSSIFSPKKNKSNKINN